MNNIYHINNQTLLPCIGVLTPSGTSIYGTIYKCSLCGKTFCVGVNGEIIL